MSAVEAAPGLSDRLRSGLRAATMRDVHGLRHRMRQVEEAAAENASLRPELARVLAQVEEQVAAFERAMSHPATDPTDG